MDTNDKLSFLEKAYGECVLAGKCKSKKQFASLVDIHYTSIISAFNGDEKYLTDAFIAKIAQYMGQITDASEQVDSPQDSILVIPTGARAGTIADFCDSVNKHECEKITSPIKGADYAIQVTGDSMSPDYPSGSMILIKQINEKAFIEWGKVYVLDTENGAVIKQIRKTENPQVIECVSINKDYQSFTMETKYIRGWYRVLMVLALK